MARHPREPAAHLNPGAFGLAYGLLWSIGVVVIGVMARFGWAKRWRELLSDAYIGYSETPSGIGVGVVWAFLDATVGKFAFAWLYNRLQR